VEHSRCTSAGSESFPVGIIGIGNAVPRCYSGILDVQPPPQTHADAYRVEATLLLHMQFSPLPSGFSPERHTTFNDKQSKKLDRER